MSDHDADLDLYLDTHPVDVLADLPRFLADTRHLGVATSECLRRLAISLESVWFDRPDDLDVIYRAALEHAPDDVDVWLSRGISAAHVAELTGGSSAHARSCLLRAWQLRPSADVAVSLGIALYHAGDPESGAWLERALEHDPSNGTAHLFVAHLLHDAERWREAVAAYERVPSDHARWGLAWEAAAYCRWRDGDRDGAVAAFRQLMARLEAEGATLLHGGWLRELATGALANELGEAYASLPLF